MNALLITTDLMASSSAEGAARKAGVALRVVGADRAAATADSETVLAAIDLGGPVEIDALVSAVRAAAPKARVIAYGPHVQEERLAAARAAGCDAVLARGAFFKQLDALLAG